MFQVNLVTSSNFYSKLISLQHFYWFKLNPLVVFLLKVSIFIDNKIETFNIYLKLGDEGENWDGSLIFQFAKHNI